MVAPYIGHVWLVQIRHCCWVLPGPLSSARGLYLSWVRRVATAATVIAAHADTPPAPPPPPRRRPLDRSKVELVPKGQPRRRGGPRHGSTARHGGSARLGVARLLDGARRGGEEPRPTAPPIHAASHRPDARTLRRRQEQNGERGAANEESRGDNPVAATPACPHQGRAKVKHTHAAEGLCPPGRAVGLRG